MLDTSYVTQKNSKLTFVVREAQTFDGIANFLVYTVKLEGCPGTMAEQKHHKRRVKLF